MTITQVQLETIRQHLKDNRLDEAAFVEEMTDHYALAIADAMRQGDDFDTALCTVYDGFGGYDGLVELEEEYRQAMGKSVFGLLWREFKRMHTQFPQVLVPVAVGVFCFLQAQKQSFSSFVEGFSVGYIVGLLLFVAQTLTETEKNTPVRRLCWQFIGAGVIIFTMFVAANNLGLADWLRDVNPLYVSVLFTFETTCYCTFASAWRRISKKHGFGYTAWG